MQEERAGDSAGEGQERYDPLPHVRVPVRHQAQQTVHPGCGAGPQGDLPGGDHRNVPHAARLVGLRSEDALPGQGVLHHSGTPVPARHARAGGHPGDSPGPLRRPQAVPEGQEKPSDGVHDEVCQVRSRGGVPALRGAEVWWQEVRRQEGHACVRLRGPEHPDPPRPGVRGVPQAVRYRVELQADEHREGEDLDPGPVVPAAVDDDGDVDHELLGGLVVEACWRATTWGAEDRPRGAPSGDVEAAAGQGVGIDLSIEGDLCGGGRLIMRGW